MKRPFFSKFIGRYQGEYIGDKPVKMAMFRFGALLVIFAAPFHVHFGWAPWKTERAEIEREQWGS